MGKAIIIYHSQGGTTRRFAREISSTLEKGGVRTELLSATDYRGEDISVYDYVFLGGRTVGLMVLGQHPDKTWEESVKKMDFPSHTRVVLFTTYKIATGSLFRRMRKCLPEHIQPVLELKSRSAELKGEQAHALNTCLSIV